MKISIPSKTVDLINKEKNEGDLSAISNLICGDNTKRQLVMVAINNGYGNEDVVRAIVDFYDRKEKILSELA